MRCDSNKFLERNLINNLNNHHVEKENDTWTSKSIKRRGKCEMKVESGRGEREKRKDKQERKAERLLFGWKDAGW